MISFLFPSNLNILRILFVLFAYVQFWHNLCMYSAGGDNMNLYFKHIMSMFVLLFLCIEPTYAQDGSISNANTAWILTSTVLVLFMTIPGLAFFYGGLVRGKNVLSVLMQCFALTCTVSILWVVFLYSLTFGDGGSMNSIVAVSYTHLRAHET